MDQQSVIEDVDRRFVFPLVLAVLMRPAMRAGCMKCNSAQLNLSRGDEAIYHDSSFEDEGTDGHHPPFLLDESPLAWACLSVSLTWSFFQAPYPQKGQFRWGGRGWFDGRRG